MVQKKKKVARKKARNPSKDCARQIKIMGIEIKIYREIGGLAIKGAERKTFLKRLMKFALDAMQCNSGVLYMPDKLTGELAPEISKGRAKKAKGTETIAPKVFKTARPYLGPGKTGATIAVALMAKKQPMGVIEVRDKTDGEPFTKADQKVLASIANHFSIIMERADLFGELKRSIKELSTLHEVGSLVTPTLDHTVVRRRAIAAITKLMRAETGSLLVVDPESNELYFEVALGDKGKRLKEVRLNAGEGIAGWVAKHGRAAVVHDVALDRRFQPGVDRHSKFQTRNMICVPVKMKGEVIGVLQAINKLGDGSFTSEDKKLFGLLSNQVAVALESARLYEEIRDTFYATSSALAEAIETRDPYTGGHTKRVLEYCLAIAKELKLSGAEVEVLRLSAVLHDVGKIGIEDSILKKNAPLNHEEQMIMKSHPEMGVEILKHVPHLKDIIPGMLHHHERIDGMGYPHRMAGDSIPLSAKIISVADTYDAMTTTRPYRTGLPPEKALKELAKHSGRQFDPKVVDAFLRAFEDGAIKETH